MTDPFPHWLQVLEEISLSIQVEDVQGTFIDQEVEMER